MAGGNSADRRKEKRSKQREDERQSRINLSFFCAAGAVSVMLGFYQKSPVWTLSLLGLLWVFVLVPLWHIFVYGLPKGLGKWLSIAVILLADTVLTCFFGVAVWPKPGLGILTVRQQQKFIQDISEAKKDRWPIRIMCPPNEEKECVVATQFIDLFGSDGWPLLNQYIDRQGNGTPRPGLYFVLHSTENIDYSKREFQMKDAAVLAETPGSIYVLIRAFADLGVQSSVQVGKDFPEHVIGLYFGSGTAK